MRHFGIISPPVSGHLNPFAALARELRSRGHRVTFFHMADVEAKIRAEGLDFHVLGERDHPPGSLPASLRELGTRKGLSAIRFTVAAVAATSEMFCRDGPAAIRSAGVDALLVDQMEPAGGAIADHLGIPFVTICNALAINRDAAVPPPFSPWPYRSSPFARLRNRIGYFASDRVTRPIGVVVDRYRRAWGLPVLRTADESFSSRAQICQMPREFDFPRSDLAETFHYVGPLRDTRPSPVAFPWDRLDGRPLIYASLGTLQNSREPLFRCFAAACAALDVQLVMSHGGGLSPEQVSALPGRPLVVSYAPQLQLLAKARLTITHAGLNTVLDSLSQGVPLLAVPITYEQPAIARRVERLGAGQTLRMDRLEPKSMSRVIQALLDDPLSLAIAQKTKESISASGQVRRAAEIIETACR